MEARESDEPHSITPPGVRSWWHARWGRFKRKAFRSEMLLYWTLIGVAVGAVVGSAVSWLQPSERVTELIGYPGELLMRALRELVLPLVALALLTGVLNLRHTTTGSSSIARWALQFYLLSMLLAVALAIGLIYTIRPGRGQPLAKMARSEECKVANLTEVHASSSQASADPVDSVLNIGRDMVPVNIVQAAADANFLGVIAISIFFGVVLSSMGEEAEPLIQNIEIANKAVIKMILYVVWLTPLGVSSLVAGSILRACDLVLLLKSLALYVFTILAGFGIHCFVVLPTLLYMYTGKDPFKAVRSFLPAFAMGFGTGSSAATMPVTMQCAVEHGCQEGVVSFVIPLGTSVNRDGAALYEAASVLFIAQAHGLGLSAGSIVLIAVTSTLAAVGAASVPMSALVTMITVLQAVNMDQFVGDVSILLAVDWCLGMFRTVTNIWGDCVAAMCVEHLSRQHEAAQSRREDSKEQEMLEEEIRLVDSEWRPERPIRQNFRPRTLSPIRGNLRKEVTPTDLES